MIPDFEQKDLLDAYFDANKEAVDFVQSKVVPVLTGQFKLSQKEEAILATFYRMHALSSSLTRLNNKLDFNTIAITTRTLFETLIDMKLLYQASELDLERFFIYPRIERYNRARKILKFQNDNIEADIEPFFQNDLTKQFVEKAGNKSEIEKDRLRLWGRDSKDKVIWPIHWTNENIRDRAKKFGAKYEHEYLEIYSMLSWYSHAGTAGYAGFSVDSLEGIYGITLNLGRKFYIESLIITGRTFRLSDAWQNFSQIVDFLKDAPQQFMVELGLKRIENAA